MDKKIGGHPYNDAFVGVVLDHCRLPLSSVEEEEEEEGQVDGGKGVILASIASLKSHGTLLLLPSVLGVPLLPLLPPGSRVVNHPVVGIDWIREPRVELRREKMRQVMLWEWFLIQVSSGGGGSSSRKRRRRSGSAISSIAKVNSSPSSSYYYYYYHYYYYHY